VGVPWTANLTLCRVDKPLNLRASHRCIGSSVGVCICIAIGVGICSGVGVGICILIGIVVGICIVVGVICIVVGIVGYAGIVVGVGIVGIVSIVGIVGSVGIVVGIVCCSRNPRKIYGNLIFGRFWEDLRNEAINSKPTSLHYTLVGTR